VRSIVFGAIKVLIADQPGIEKIMNKKIRRQRLAQNLRNPQKSHKSAVKKSLL
jgi:hypothetical protein